MNASERGLKRICLECATKYYDLGKEVAACPKCGAEAPAVKLPTPAQPVRKTGRLVFGRYPK
jgi:hypothetical protein